MLEAVDVEVELEVLAELVLDAEELDEVTDEELLISEDVEVVVVVAVRLDEYFRVTLVTLRRRYFSVAL